VLAELAAELVVGRAAVVALAEFEAVAKAAAAIKQALEEKTLTLVRPTRRMLKVFCFGPHTLELTVPQGSVVARREEDEIEMLKKGDEKGHKRCRAGERGVEPSHGGGRVCTTPY
jgi:hypothetical protein